MKRLFTGMCLLLAAASASAGATGEGKGTERGVHREANRSRYTIQGVVVDEHGRPLPGAAIQVLGTTVGAGTDTDGVFVLRLGGPEARRLRVSFLGYEPHEVQAVPDAEARTTVHVQLEPAANELDEVVVTGSFIEKPLKEVPVLTRVISAKDIRALNPPDVESLLQYALPGMQFGYDAAVGQPKMTYQGMEAQYMLFLVDGERMGGEGLDRSVDFARLNVDNIERIEVVKGSQSTLYGSNALGGVVHIITKDAGRPFTGNLAMRYAGTDGQKYTASAGMKKNGFSSYTSLTWRQRDTYEVADSEGRTVAGNGTGSNGTSATDNPATTRVYGYRIWDFSQKLGYEFNERLSVHLKGSLYHNRRDKTKKESSTGWMSRDHFMGHTLGGHVKWLPGHGQQVLFSYLFDHYDKDKHFYERGQTRNDYRNVWQVPRVDYTGSFGAHTVSIGFEAHLERLKHYMMKDSATVDQQTYALYAQEDWKLTDRLNLVAGVRADFHQAYNLHLTPRLTALWRPVRCLALRGGFSQGFRAPSLKELYQEYDMGGMGFMMLYGNPDLKPETSNQWAFSAELTEGPLNLSVSANHTRFHDKIALVPTGEGRDQQYVNAEKARTTSVEAILRYRLRMGLTLTGSYAYVDDHQEMDGRNTSYTRPHTLVFQALFARAFGRIGTNLSLNGQWASHLDTYEAGSGHTYQKVAYGPRTLCSLNAGVALPKGIGLNVGIDNLFNYKDKASSSGLQMPQTGLSWVGTVHIDLAAMLGL